MLVRCGGLKDLTPYQHPKYAIAQPEATIEAEYGASKHIVAVDLCIFPFQSASSVSHGLGWLFCEMMN